MFKDVNDFFDKVANGDELSQIEIENYVYSITRNHDIDGLITFGNDLRLYFNQRTINFIINISEEEISKKFDSVNKKPQFDVISYLLETVQDFSEEEKNDIKEYQKEEKKIGLSFDGMPEGYDQIEELFEDELRRENENIIYLLNHISKLIALKKIQPQSEQPHQLKTVLKEMFPYALGNQLELLHDNLTIGKSDFVKLNFIGQKKSLWYRLGKVYSCGVDRVEILRVFSKCVEWKQNNIVESKPLNSIEINKKLPSKRG